LCQPYRARLLPAFGPVLEAAEKAGALGGFLSGSGSTLMALALARPKIVCKAMLAAALRAKTPSQVFILTADNSGHRILRNPAREL
jgi:homoserine kinase